MIWDAVVFLISLLVLAKASHSALKASINIAKIIGIGEFAVGFVLISVMTSLPEIMVSIAAGINGAGEIVIGNIIGSNIVNTLVVLGTVAYFQGIRVVKKEFIDNAAFLFGISGISLALLLRGVIGFWSGVILITIFILYAALVLKTKISLNINNFSHTLTIMQALAKSMSMTFLAIEDALVLIIAMMLVMVSSNYMVQSATSIATALGISSAIIAVTIIAFGTSLPEMAIAAQAIITRHRAIALGEVIGSSIVNLTLVLGAGALFTPIPIVFESIGSALITMVMINLALWYLMSTRRMIGKTIGAVAIACYAFFILLEIGLVTLA